MKRLSTATLALSISAGAAFAQQDVGLLHFDWLSDDQSQRVEEAHTAFSDAHEQVCGVIVDIYAEHVERGGDASLSDEQTAFYKRQCAADAFAGHIERSIGLHEAIHGAASGHSH